MSLFTLKRSRNSLISPFFLSSYSPLFFFPIFSNILSGLPRSYLMGTTWKIRRMKSIIACVWSVSIVSWCRQYLILFILLFSYPLVKVKLQISSYLSLYITFFIFSPIICILVFSFSFCPSSSSPSSSYSPSFSSLSSHFSLSTRSASWSSSSSRESSSSPSFLFLFFHFIGWSRNWYIRYPQLRSTSNSSSTYSLCEYPSRCFVCLYFCLPNWRVIMWMISSVRKICLNKASLPGRFSHSSSSDGMAVWMGTDFPRISSKFRKGIGTTWTMANFCWLSKEISTLRTYAALTGLLCKRDKWKQELGGSSTKFISFSPNPLQYFIPLFIYKSIFSPSFLL